jgi:hypothetical protein
MHILLVSHGPVYGSNCPYEEQSTCRATMSTPPRSTTALSATHVWIERSERPEAIKAMTRILRLNEMVYGRTLQLAEKSTVVGQLFQRQAQPDFKYTPHSSSDKYPESPKWFVSFFTPTQEPPRSKPQQLSPSRAPTYRNPTNSKLRRPLRSLGLYKAPVSVPVRLHFQEQKVAARRFDSFSNTYVASA